MTVLCSLDHLDKFALFVVPNLLDEIDLLAGQLPSDHNLSGIVCKILQGLHNFRSTWLKLRQGLLLGLPLFPTEP